MGVPDPESHLPPGHAERSPAPTGEAARGVLFAALLRQGGLPVEEVATLAAPLAAEEERVAQAVQSFLEDGAWRPPGTNIELTCDRLEVLPRSGEWLHALDTRALRRDLDGLTRYRLGELYAACGETEKAANAYRLVLALPEPLSYAIAIEIAEAAAKGGHESLALGAIDRLASIALHEPGQLGHPDARARARTLGALLCRGREAAMKVGSPLRAAALGRAATNFFERAHLGRELREAQLGAIEALCAAGQPDLGMGYAKKMRESAQEDDDAADEARAILAASVQLLRENEHDKVLALRRRAATILEEKGDVVRAAEARLLAAAILEGRGQLEQARKELADAAGRLETGEHASDPARRRLALQLRDEEVDLLLRLGRPAEVLKRADLNRRGWEQLGNAQAAASALVVLAQALLLAGDRERAWKALERAADDLELGVGRASSFRVRAELRYLEGDARAARILLHDAERTFQEAGAIEWQLEAHLRRAELLLSQGEAEAARKVLETLRGKAVEPGGRFEIRRELLGACLSEDSDEAELLLEDLHAQAENEGQLADRVLVAVAKARRHLEQGDAFQAQETIQPVLASLVAFRRELPDAFQKGLRDSPLGHEILGLAEQIKKAKE